MNQSAILSFRTPDSDVGRVEALAAPVLELAYCVYIVTRAERRERTAELAWLAELEQHEPDLTNGIRNFFGTEGNAPGFDLFLMACNFGYARDDTVDRFLADLPTLPARLLEQLDEIAEKAMPKKQDVDHEPYLELYRDLHGRLEQLIDGGAAVAYGGLLRRLWERLAPRWEIGRAEVSRVAEAFLAKFRSSQDVLAALPPHHFTHFEAHAKQIRASQQLGRVIVVPLYFASDGGFNLDLQEAHFIGFGMQSEDVFQTTAARLTELAGRMKAFADPTRLILMGLIARFARFQLTVTDLSQQLGVSQPTVSGHLKVLREAGLVSLERKGNKAFYQIDREAVRELLGGLAAELLDG